MDRAAFGARLRAGVWVGLFLCGPSLLAQTPEPAAGAPRSYPASALCPLVGDPGVTRALKPIRQSLGVPAMAAAVVTSEGIKFVGAVGVRKRGTDVPVTLDDQWHLGSDTKAMTAALVARMVERSQLKWDMTFAEVFPYLAPQMHAQFRKVTLLHLLSHRAGLPANLTLASYAGDDVLALRSRAVREELAKPPRHAPGSAYEYSNLGYILAGAVVEKVTGEPWERVVSRELFEPLHMKAAGFGGTGSPRSIDQPWPHQADGEPVSEHGPAVDNPPVMGPAGRVHCTIQDWARFVQDQLRGARGEGALLKPASYQKLHTPPFGGSYALGWITARRPWSEGIALTHAGNNTMNYANVWIAPQRNFAILVCVNQGGYTAFKATDLAVLALMKLLDPKP